MHVGSFLVGAALGLASAEAMRRLSPRGAVAGAGVGLVTAAVIYPGARRSLRSGGLAVEVGVLALASAVSGAAAQAGGADGRRIAAAGWAGHAVFDAVQGASPDSRLPAWYPAMCAGYDLALAARIAV